MCMFLSVLAPKLVFARQNYITIVLAKQGLFCREMKKFRLSRREAGKIEGRKEMVCQKCGVEIENTAKVCKECGALQEGFKFCKYCGEAIEKDCVVCPKCGKQVEQIQSEQASVVINNSNNNVNTNVNRGGGYGREKNKWVAVLLCFFLGGFGAHKFYEGKVGMGILYLFTVGLFGIGWFIDFIALLLKPNPYYV